MKNVKSKKGTKFHKSQQINFRCTDEQKLRIQALTEIMREVLGDSASQADVIFFMLDRYEQQMIDSIPKKNRE